MHIKKQSQERREIDIKEWNDEVKAYIRPLNGFEQLAFNDYFITFFSDQKSYEERYKAGFNAAKSVPVLGGAISLDAQDARDFFATLPE